MPGSSLCLAATRAGLGAGLRQRGRKAGVDPHAVQPRGQVAGPSLQGAPPVAAGLLQELQPDARAVVLVPAPHHAAVPPRRGAGVAAAVEDVVQVPSFGPRTMSPRAESTVRTRGARGAAPPQRFPGAGSYIPASSGSAARSSVLLAGPLSHRWRNTAEHARSSQRSPSAATP